MADLVQELEAQFAESKVATLRQSVGVVREVSDGVARVEGLADVMLNEMVDFGRGITGLALNLDETEVAVIVLGDHTQLREGDEVRGTGKLRQVPVGKGLLGRVVNTLGEPLDGNGSANGNKGQLDIESRPKQLVQISPMKRSRLTVKPSSRPRISPSALMLCRGCRRYVFADTVTCPFCTGDINALAAAYHDRLRAARKLSQRLRKRLKRINI